MQRKVAWVNLLMQTNIFQFDDYRKFLQECLKESTSEEKLTLVKLADSCRVKSPYLSKCLSGTADLNTDQAHCLGTFLGLNEEELNYFLELVEYSRSYIESYKKYLKKKIKSTQKQNLRTETNIKTAELSEETKITYYLDPLNLIIHMCATLEKSLDVKALSKSLHISEDKVLEVVNQLIMLGIIKQEGSRYVSVVKGLHLPSNSPLCRPHQMLMRQKVLNFQEALSEEGKGYNTMFTFSCDYETYIKIKNEFLSFLKITDKLIDQSHPSGVYQLQFDLFPWALK
jgi:uncharacterized protein (TIGR02147 family)